MGVSVGNVSKKLGRPPKLREKGTTVGAHVPISLALLLEEVARLQGRSVSDIVREALELYLQEEAVKLGLQSVFATASKTQAGGGQDPPSVDPLTQLDVEDFEEQLSRFEGELSKLKGEADRVKGLMRDLGYGVGGKPLPPHLEEYAKRLVKRALALKHEWLRLKGWYRKLPPNPNHANRLVEARLVLRDVERLVPQK